ncbi:MAG: class I SAM-dependent methyltransferase [Nitrospirae bacterium]|nr:class I SAM-dependent methyltransferase [Nitrospirota bacterium]
MKTVMCKKGVSLRSKIESALFLYRAYKNKSFADAKRTIWHHQRLLGYLYKYVGIPVEKARILEIGCGQTARQVALFHADGASVVGIDIDAPTYKMNFSVFLKVARLNGMERALKSLTRHILFDKKFFTELSREYGKPVTFNNLDVRIMDATNTSFETDSFDFIFSNMVFQHIDNLEGAVREVNRMLKPSGIAAISIHLFPSISGGICHEWLNPDQLPSMRVPPWDHLRDNKFPVNIYLNKFTIKQYRNIFRAYTRTVEEQTTTEGEKILTPEIERDLKNKGYTREDLLTRTIIFIFGKRESLNG